MSYEIKFDDGTDEGEVFSLASSAGWRDMTDWIETLDKKKYERLIELANEGMITGTDALAKQLRSAIKHQTPKDETVLATAKNLLSMIGIGNPVELAIVTA